MPIPNNKLELIEAIHTNYDKLIVELKNIPIELTMIKELESHKKNNLMSINNLIAYLIGWQELVLKWNDKKMKGLEVDFPETGFKWNELGSLALKFYKDYVQYDFNQLCTHLEESKNNIIKLIDNKSNEELYNVVWYEKWTLGRMIQLNTSSPFNNAKIRVRKWKKAKGIK